MLLTSQVDVCSQHKRVCEVAKRVQEKGELKLWLDEEALHGDIYKQMTDGIDNSQCVIVFITPRYIEKANGKGKNKDNDKCAGPFESHTVTRAVNLSQATV